MKKKLFTLGTLSLISGIALTLISEISIKADAVIGSSQGIKVMAGILLLGLFLILISFTCFGAALSRKK